VPSIHRRRHSRKPPSACGYGRRRPETAYAEHSELDHVAETLAHRFANEVVPDPDDPEAEERLALLSGYRSNAMGLMRYLDLRAEGRTAT
jgi:hypothetical protein